MNITLNVTYKIIRYILTSKEFSQTEIHNKTGSSLGQINKVVNWLVTRKFVERNKGTYHMVDPAGIIAVFPLFRNMGDLLARRISIRGDLKKILEKLPQGSVL